MRCMIFARSSEAEWLKEYFPDVDPFLLKIVNKPLLEYILDIVTLIGISEIRIVSDSSIKEIEHSIGDGSKWGTSISYTLAKPGDSLKNVYLKNYSFCKENNLLIWNGFFFAKYDRNEVKNQVYFSDPFYCGKNKRLIYIPQGQNLNSIKDEKPKDDCCITVYDINSIVDYYQLSMDILTNCNRNW